MSLSGNLEDLPLLDILQIVTYSRKTGFLAINTSGGLGAIVFNDGLVVSAFSPETRPLQVEPGITPEKHAAALRTRVEIALEQLIRLREGNFEFSLSEKTPRVIDGRDISAELLEDGFNAQGLLLDLARGIDEDRRNSSAAIEASFVDAPPVETPPATGRKPDDFHEDLEQIEEAELGPLPEEFQEVGADEVQAATEPDLMTPPAPQPSLAHAAYAAPAPPATAPDDETPAILLVDDEADVRQVLVESFTSAGYQVIEADDPDAAVKKAGKLGKAGIRFLLVCDLGMPTSGGSSFQGGFEVVKKLMKMHMHPPVLLMAERLNGSLQARAKQMGVSSIVFKPGLSKLDPDQFRSDLRAFADRLKRDILPQLAAAPAAAKTETPKKAPAKARASGSAAPEEGSRDIAVLQSRLVELRQQSDPTQISYMVMKTAREFFERGILLLIKDAEARGLAGFGPAPRGENINLAVRDVAIPLSDPSPFADAITRRKPLMAIEPEGKWMANLYGKIGKFRATSGAILPLLAHREVIALLYGDNPETGREVKRADALALFVDQAGLALENLFLQRKVRALETTPASPPQP